MGGATVKEWAATSNEFVFDSDGEPYAPHPPEGDGWRLVSVVLCKKSRNDSTGPVYYWERMVSDE